jgi:tRNA pseudouridine38-40 synthase
MDVPYYLRLAYVGTSYHGWQIQTSLPSVQRELWTALQAFDPAAPMPQGTGRTDAGVHALAQGVLVHLGRSWDPYRLLAALNAHLPDTIRVLEAMAAPEGFFPRHHAVAKRYVYRIAEGPAENPFEHGRRWHVRGLRPLDQAAMVVAAAGLLGRHDFSSFRAAECAAMSPIRTIHKVDLQASGPRLDLVFEGDRFLMHQIRIMSGTLVEVGKGRLQPSRVSEILAGRNRSLAGPTAPADGLWLEKVWYQARWGIGEACPWPEANKA